jgi:3-dehydroquinate dehydratase/shikimate dehydrogenase
VTGKICVSVCARKADELIRKIQQAASIGEAVEVRFDCLDPFEVDDLLNRLPTIAKPYVITYRPSEQGGMRVLPRAERIKFWVKVGKKLSGIEYFSDTEVDLYTSSGGLPKRQIVSLHEYGEVPRHASLNRSKLTPDDNAVVKIAIMARDACDAIPVWKLLANGIEGATAVIPIAMGEPGKWTRILGPAYGAFLTYGALAEDDKTAPGQITAEDLKTVFRVNEISNSTEVYGVLAGDTSYSMSPYVQNAGFKKANMDRVFIPLQVGRLSDFFERMVRQRTREIDLNFRGFAVTNPHKTDIVQYLDEVDDAAEKIGAVNTVAIVDNRIKGFNTDADGFIKPLLAKYGDLSRKQALVLGGGGAARACAYALMKEGSEVTVASRNAEKATKLAEDFGANIEALSRASFQQKDIVVNATPVGTRGNPAAPLANASDLSDVELVYDLNYNPAETALLRQAKLAGCETLGGLEMLLHQAAAQFRIWTGETPDLEVMREAAQRRLSLESCQ